MQACIASLLELSLDAVPNFMENGDHWWTALREWAALHGYSPLEITWSIEERHHRIFPNDGQVCWAVGKSPRGDYKHAILVKWKEDEWQLCHDPHPDNIGLDGEIELIGMLVRMGGK